MKKFILPLVTAAVIISIMFAGCAPGAPEAPPVAPPEAPPVAPPEAPPVAPPALENPYEGLAIKPDGTPYRFAITPPFLGCDFAVNGTEFLSSLFTRAGGEVIVFDPGFDAQKQVSFVEDVVSLKRADAIIAWSCSEAAMAPPSDMATAAGIPVYAYDIEIYSDSPVTWVHHDFDGPAGTCVVGEYYRQVAEETGKQINIFEVWGEHAQETVVERHNGFHAGLANHPLITVTESADCHMSDEIAASLVMDGFTAHPELNGLFVQAGGSTGAVEGLDAIGRLLPYADPNHVIVAVNDCDTRVVLGIDEGEVDGTGSHGPVDMAGVLVKLVFYHLVLGQQITKEVSIPMVFISHDNIDTLEKFGVPAAWPRLPHEQWDLWPVLDTSEIGIETPTKAMRMELVGY